MLKSSPSENKLTRSWKAVREGRTRCRVAVTCSRHHRGLFAASRPASRSAYQQRVRQSDPSDSGRQDRPVVHDRQLDLDGGQAGDPRGRCARAREPVDAPNCVDPATGAPSGGTVDASGACASGEPEFNAIKDIHIGVVTSSLGGHGGQVCGDMQVATNPILDDHARLVASIRPGNTPALTSWNNAGFLAWDRTGTKNTPAGEADPGALDCELREPRDSGRRNRLRLGSLARSLVPLPDRSSSARQRCRSRWRGREGTAR